MLSFEEGLSHFKRIFGITPQIIAHDLHPQYLSTKWAQENFNSSEWKGRVFGVQHHHAHLISCPGENNHRGLALGLALMAPDMDWMETWGGELYFAMSEILSASGI